MRSRQCSGCSIELTEREWDEGNGKTCYDCRIAVEGIRVTNIWRWMLENRELLRTLGFTEIPDPGRHRG